MYVESFLLVISVAVVVPYIFFGVVNSLIVTPNDDRKEKNTPLSPNSSVSTKRPGEKTSLTIQSPQSEKVAALVRRDLAKKSPQTTIIPKTSEKTPLSDRRGLSKESALAVPTPEEKNHSLVSRTKLFGKTGVNTKIQQVASSPKTSEKSSPPDQRGLNKELALAVPTPEEKNHSLVSRTKLFGKTGVNTKIQPKTPIETPKTISKTDVDTKSPK